MKRPVSTSSKLSDSVTPSKTRGRLRLRTPIQVDEKEAGIDIFETERLRDAIKDAKGGDLKAPEPRSRQVGGQVRVRRANNGPGHDLDNIVRLDDADIDITRQSEADAIIDTACSKCN
jgi:hypothetical protein